LYVRDNEGNTDLIVGGHFTVSLDVSDAEVYIRESTTGKTIEELTWAFDLLAQVVISRQTPVIPAAAQAEESLKGQVKALVREKEEIRLLELEIAELEISGSAKDLDKAMKNLAKARISYAAIQEKLLEKKQRQIEKQANSQKKVKRKKVANSNQRLRALSKALPPVNTTKRDKMRNGFKSMSPNQLDQLKAMKRSVLD
jgi:hypothetical protein